MLNKPRREAPAERLVVFEDTYALMFDKVTRVAAKKKSSDYASKDNTRPSRSPDYELGGVIDAVQRGLRSAALKIQ